jgi:hypothetical protein
VTDEFCSRSPEGVVEIEMIVPDLGRIKERWAIETPTVSKRKSTDRGGMTDMGSDLL